MGTTRVTAVAALFALALAGCTAGTKDAAPGATATPAPTQAGRPATVVWQQKLRPIGQPLVADGVAVLEATDAKGLLVVGLDAATGKRLWSDRASAGNVVPGIEVRPALVHGKDGRQRVAYYRRNPRENLSAQLVVADLRTGRPVVATPPGHFTTSVGACDDKLDVCVSRFDEARRKRLALRLQLPSGRLVPDPAGAPPGTYDIGDGLLQSITSGPKTLSVVDGKRVRWRRPLAELFPGGYTPDAGWSVRLDREAQVYVVSLGNEQGKKPVDLSRVVTTAGIDARTGRQLWLHPGTWRKCNGDVAVDGDDDVRYPVRCRYKGIGRYRQEPVVKDVAIEGFDATTGRTAWSVSAGPAGALFGRSSGFGTLARVDARSVLVAVPQRASLIVDLTTGLTRGPLAGEVFACTTPVRWRSPETWYVDDQEINDWRGGVVLYACDAGGKATKGQLTWDSAASVGGATDAIAVVSTLDTVVGLTK